MAPRSHKSRCRKGFTLIEIMTVIAIIAVLITLVTLGVSHISKAAKQNSTHVTMQNLNALMTERQTHGGTGGIDQIFTTQTWTGGGNQPSQVAAPGDASALLPSDPQQPLTGLVQGQAGIEANSPLAATVLAMYILSQSPNNKKMLAGLPSNATRLVNAPVSGASPPTPQTVSVPVMLDAWGHPMLYVPGHVVNTQNPEGPNNLTGSFTGVTVSGGNNAPDAKTIRSSDGRGFWVSAGPDGYFTDLNTDPNARKPFGDDNIYSFEQ